MSEDQDTLKLLQMRVAELIKREPASEEKARERAELLLVLMHQALAHAHMACAENDHDESESFFDLAEEAGREAFSVEKLSVARYTDDSTPYKLALGAILSAGKSFKADTTTRVGDFVRLSLCEVLCRIQGIDPDEMREAYRVWQAEPDLEAGEVHNDVDVQA
ncbi:MAG: hypothetical protein IKF14_05870 [Atopobiaceae bacterium]|nr:hypothetical protein [Atopobiaceae bacterium]